MKNMQTKKIDKNKQDIYNSYLEILTNKVIKNNSKIIYLTQTSGYGMNDKLYLIAETYHKNIVKNFSTYML